MGVPIVHLLVEEIEPVLSSRFAAEELRARIERELTGGADVVVSFEGVIAISPSFADELFAKMPPEAERSGRLRFVDLSEDLLAIARFVKEGRGRS
jgi:hypothetical protein